MTPPPAATATFGVSAPSRRRLTGSKIPRRWSGAEPARSARSVARSGAEHQRSRFTRFALWLWSLPDGRILGRIITGRSWIFLIGTLLVGLVSVQVALLKVNAGLGQAVHRAAVLERQSAELQDQIALLADHERIQAMAYQQGMIEPQAGQVRYLAAHPERDGKLAVRVMQTPNVQLVAAHVDPQPIQ